MTDFFKPKPPPAPNNVQVKDKTPHSIEFCWDEPPRPKDMPKSEIYIMGYEVFYKIEDSKPKRRIVDGFTTSILVKGLNPGTLVHDFTVKGRSEGGWGLASLPPFQARSLPAPPGQVDWAEVTDCTDHSADLKWSRPSIENGAAVKNYKIQVYQPGKDGSTVELETGSEVCRYVVTGLKPGTAYMFSVCAENESGWGAWVSSPAYGLTRAAPPTRPMEVIAVKTTVDSVTVRFRTPFSNGSDLTGYELIYEDEERQKLAINFKLDDSENADTHSVSKELST